MTKEVKTIIVLFVVLVVAGAVLFFSAGGFNMFTKAEKEITVVPADKEISSVVEEAPETKTSMKVLAPVVESKILQEPVTQAVVQTESDVPSNGGEDLEFPKSLPYPDWVGDSESWKALSQTEREAKVSEVLGVTVKGVTGEEIVAFSFNADGIALTDIKLVPHLLYEIHISKGDQGRVVYLLSDKVVNLSEYDGWKTGDTTVRIEGFLTSELSKDEKLCLPFWNSYEFNGRNGLEVKPLGYFADPDIGCNVVPDAFKADDQDLLDTFKFLYKNSRADLTMIGTWPGVWYFWTDLANQSVTCPTDSGWLCIATTDDVKSDANYSYFTEKVENAYASYLFDPDELTQADIEAFIAEARLIVK